MAADELTARGAAAFLGVKVATIYAYVSRGLLTSVPAARGRARRYPRGDLERLKSTGGAPLTWGEPVLESSITAIGPDGPRYRGETAVRLVEGGARFEEVAALLWAVPPAPDAWRMEGLGVPLAPLRSLVEPGTHPLTALSIFVPALAALDPTRHRAGVERAPALVKRMAAAAGLGFATRAESRFLYEERSVARTLAHALQARETPGTERAIDAGLILAADHELNASTFAARVAASAGADIYACVSAALATLSGPRHGGTCDRIEALVAEAGGPAGAAAVLKERIRRGDAVPGFGHPLYPKGDPRTPPLLRLAASLGRKDRQVATLFEIVDAAPEAGLPPPTVDTGLVALALALGMPDGSAAALFAIGRAAGWVAHVLEQRASGVMLRPRARYVGP